MNFQETRRRSRSPSGPIQRTSAGCLSRSVRAGPILLASCLVATLPNTAGASGAAAALDAYLGTHLAALTTTYQQIHAHPELSLEESATAALVAGSLRDLGFEVSEGIGGHGVAGVLENGKGPVVLIRADMDALPITEETGLPYASHVRVTGEDGSETGVMHACGHDIHTVHLIGVAGLLSKLRDEWSGTVVAIGQPAEEIGRGSLAMISDGLFDRIPKPDYVLALHVESSLPAGRVGLTSGWAGANVDEVTVTIHGRGGHGARPHQAVDPITTAAYFVTQLQTLVSRRVDPLQPAVVSVGSIHGGERYNIIPNEVELQLTVRSYSDEVRALLLEGIRQLARDTCATHRCPKEPDIWIREHHTPSVYNDPALVERAKSVLGELLGYGNVVSLEPSMGGDDFARYSRELGVPGLMIRVGSQSRDSHDRSLEPNGPPLPALHSSRFAPDAGATLDTAIRSMGSLTLDLLSIE